MNKSDRQIIRDRITDLSDSYEAGTVRIGADGAVSVIADPMPNTNERGRIFVGWDTEVLSDIQ